MCSAPSRRSAAIAQNAYLHTRTPCARASLPLTHIYARTLRAHEPPPPLHTHIHTLRAPRCPVRHRTRPRTSGSSARSPRRPRRAPASKCWSAARRIARSTMPARPPHCAAARAYSWQCAVLNPTRPGRRRRRCAPALVHSEPAVGALHAHEVRVQPRPVHRAKRLGRARAREREHGGVPDAPPPAFMYAISNTAHTTNANAGSPRTSARSAGAAPAARAAACARA